MQRTTSLGLYTKTQTFSAEQVATQSYVYRKTITGNLMPKSAQSLTQAQLMLYGIDATVSNIKELYCDGDAYLTVGVRLEYGADKYDVVAVNVWPNHTEALLIPVRT